MHRLTLVIPCGLVIALVEGCGAGQGDIHGQVKYQGKVVSRGSVVMVGGDRRPLVGRIESDGTYSLKGVPAGLVRIGVLSPSPGAAANSLRRAPQNRKGPADLKANSGRKWPTAMSWGRLRTRREANGSRCPPSTRIPTPRASRRKSVAGITLSISSCADFRKGDAIRSVTTTGAVQRRTGLFFGSLLQARCSLVVTSGTSLPRAVARSIWCSCSLTRMPRMCSARAYSPSASHWRTRSR